MGTDALSTASSETRAREWLRGTQESVCDSIEPWEQGTVLRAARYPTYYNFNLVRVEGRAEIDAQALVAFTDRALSDLGHRRIDIEAIELADELRPELLAGGWRTTRLLWMRHEAPPAIESVAEVHEVPYDAVGELRTLWHDEDFPESESVEYEVAAREVAMTRDVRVLAAVEGGRPIGFAQMERAGSGAEVSQVYVHPDYRGQGRGTAITRAAIESAGDVEDLWIAADDEDRPKELYGRLGFRPAWRMMEFLLLP
jgi:GNAT superfamily N-acetyltransferase